LLHQLRRAGVRARGVVSRREPVYDDVEIPALPAPDSRFPMTGPTPLDRTLEPTGVPVTAKIRLGWDDDSIITRTLPVALADRGVAAVTVHGRTTAMKFKGECRHEGIAEVVESVKAKHPDVAVIGNGDVKTPQDAKRMLGDTGCDGVIIGRGALGQPWLFRDAAAYLATGTLPEPYPRLDRARCVLEHFENLLRFRDERIAMATIKRRMSWYSRHLQPWPGLKRDVQNLPTAAAFRDFMHEGMQRIEQHDPEVHRDPAAHDPQPVDTKTATAA
ncbi:MAG: tRNA dihydrouridine synthase, partial [Phycisphaeraceae bacterium]